MQFHGVPSDSRATYSKNLKKALSERKLDVKKAFR